MDNEQFNEMPWPKWLHPLTEVPQLKGRLRKHFCKGTLPTQHGRRKAPVEA